MSDDATPSGSSIAAPSNVLCGECCAQPASFIASFRSSLGKRRRLTVCVTCAKALKNKFDQPNYPFSYFDLMPVQNPSADSMAATRLDTIEKAIESLRSDVNKFAIAAAVLLAAAGLAFAGLNSLINSKAETSIKEVLPKFMESEASRAAAVQVRKAFNSYLGAEKEGAVINGPIKQGLRFVFHPSMGTIGVQTSTEPRKHTLLPIWKAKDKHENFIVPKGAKGTRDTNWLFSDQNGSRAQTSYSPEEYLWTSRILVPITASHLMINVWIPERGVHADLRVLAPKQA